MSPMIREYSYSSELIGQHRPWDADDPTNFSYFFDQEASTDGAAVASLAGLMFVIETVDELGSKASVNRLHEQRPTAGVPLQQLGPLL